MGLATVKTDIAGLDTLLGGGIPKGSTMLISGPPGAGKTVMALQYTFNQARKGGRVLFVSTHELLYSINKFASTMSFFDLNLVRTGVNLDFYGPREEGGFVEFWDYSLGTIAEGEYAGDIYDIVQERVSSHRIDHLVVDSISSIRLFTGDDLERRRKLLLFLGWASRSGCTTIFTAEGDGIERMLVDDIVDLGKQEIAVQGGPGIAVKTLEVVKLRGQEHCFGRYLYNISNDGITVLAPGTGSPPEVETAKTGVTDLDEIISGMPYGSTWHFIVRYESLCRPLMDTMVRETLASGDSLVYFASAADDFSLEAFRWRFGAEGELKGRLAIVDPFGLPAADKIKDFIVSVEMGENAGVPVSRQRLVKGKRIRIIADAGSMERWSGIAGAWKALEFSRSRAREKGELLIVFSGPSADGPLSSNISAASDGFVDVWGYGGYALLRVRKAPYAKSFEPFVARLEQGQIRLKRL
ncbi:MAG TPA: ATPase domain-containing protein [Methanocella sp.]|uniref:RAD55 family ATPase n=1 Tax=Methanocella sp. TaxID=2052833 RepID=UPI002D052566|nr:ATPase domain-containing protein [Methanocella sp.]HTY90114.1 ATPase domain-containing protein [Methanocella sp.]